MARSTTTAIPVLRSIDVDAVMLPILRVGAALLFMQHGAQKLFGLFGGTPVELFSQMGLAGVLEFFGGLLLAIGLFARPIAVLLVGLMLSAFLIAHFPQGGLPIENGGELSLMFTLVFAYILFRGPGAYSLDKKLFPRLS